MSPTEMQEIIAAVERIRKTVREDIDAILSTLVKHINGNKKQHAKYDKMIARYDERIERLDRASEKHDKMLIELKRSSEDHEKWLRDHDVRFRQLEEVLKR